jgi:MFS family permease
MTATSVKWLLAVCMVAYVVGGTVVFVLWLGRLGRRRPPLPNARLTPLPLRLHVAHQAYVLGGGVLLSLALPFMTPVLQRTAAPTYILGCAIALVGLSALYAVLDVWAITRSRRTVQQQADAHPDDAAASP